MRIKKILLSVVALVLPAVFMTSSVSAGTNDTNITYQKVDGAYFYMQNKTTGAVDTNYVTKFFLNEKLSYCIEPMQDINTKIYNSTNDWSITNLSKEQREYIELVGYFGYDYPGHRTDNYWLAAQSLIWQKANSNISVRITNGENGTGGDYDLTKETNEILSLIENYKKLPSFANTTIEGNIDSEITINDTAGVLDNFNMSYSGKHQITKNGNTLNIKFARNEITNETIKFYKTNYDNEATIIYYQESSQKLASLRISNPLEFTINLKSRGATVNINKIGEKIVYENASFRYEQAKVPNTKFALYANEDILDSAGNIIYKAYQLIDTLITDSDSIATVSDLPLGKYFFVEVESVDNHLLDMEKYYFEITNKDIVDGKLFKHFDFKNYLPKGKLIFSKTDCATGKGIAGAVFQIFTEDDKLIYTGTSNEKGEIIIENLPATSQKYYIIEKSAATGYKISDEKVYFEINSNGEIVKVNMTNEKIKGNLIFKKTDENGNALAGVKINIYKKDGALYGTYTTNQDGLVEIKNIEYGEYKVQEISTIDGYELEDDVLYFSILEDGEDVNLSMINKKMPQTSMNDYTKDFAILLIALGGVIVIVRLRKKQK